MWGTSQFERCKKGADQATYRVKVSLTGPIKTNVIQCFRNVKTCQKGHITYCCKEQIVVWICFHFLCTYHYNYMLVHTCHLRSEVQTSLLKWRLHEFWKLLSVIIFRIFSLHNQKITFSFVLSRAFYFQNHFQNYKKKSWMTVYLCRFYLNFLIVVVS